MRTSLLKITLLITGLLLAVYGISMLFFTQGYMEMSGSEPINPTWLRWMGAFLLAFGYGSFRVLRKPAQQGIFVHALVLAMLINGLTLLYTLIFEMQPEDATWFTALPAIGSLLLAGLLWKGSLMAKETLKQQ
jgi:uncharacterized membrane protein